MKDLMINKKELYSKMFLDFYNVCYMEYNDSITRLKILEKLNSKYYITLGFIYEDYEIVCDETNNTSTLINNHGIQCDIYCKIKLSDNSDIIKFYIWKDEFKLFINNIEIDMKEYLKYNA